MFAAREEAGPELTKTGIRYDREPMSTCTTKPAAKNGAIVVKVECARSQSFPDKPPRMNPMSR
jgi:hypothetical protein